MEHPGPNNNELTYNENECDNNGNWSEEHAEHSCQKQRAATESRMIDLWMQRSIN